MDVIQLAFDVKYFPGSALAEKMTALKEGQFLLSDDDMLRFSIKLKELILVTWIHLELERDPISNSLLIPCRYAGRPLRVTRMGAATALGAATAFYIIVNRTVFLLGILFPWEDQPPPNPNGDGPPPTSPGGGGTNQKISISSQLFKVKNGFFDDNNGDGWKLSNKERLKLCELFSELLIFISKSQRWTGEAQLAIAGRQVTSYGAICLIDRRVMLGAGFFGDDSAVVFSGNVFVHNTGFIDGLLSNNERVSAVTGNGRIVVSDPPVALEASIFGDVSAAVFGGNVFVHNLGLVDGLLSNNEVVSAVAGDRGIVVSGPPVALEAAIFGGGGPAVFGGNVFVHNVGFVDGLPSNYQLVSAVAGDGGIVMSDPPIALKAGIFGITCIVIDAGAVPIHGAYASNGLDFAVVEVSSLTVRCTKTYISTKQDRGFQKMFFARCSSRISYSMVGTKGAEDLRGRLKMNSDGPADLDLCLSAPSTFRLASCSRPKMTSLQ